MPRAYVMGNKGDGKSDVLQDQEISFEKDNTLDLWINYTTPANLNAVSDPVVGKPFNHEPPNNGATFRIARFMPGMADNATPEEIIAHHHQLRSIHVPTKEELEKAKHPSMHRTDTLNYFIVLSGRIWALTEGRDVELGPGDTIVQHGCMHGWKVEGPEPCILAAVLIKGIWGDHV